MTESVRTLHNSIASKVVICAVVLSLVLGSLIYKLASPLERTSFAGAAGNTLLLILVVALAFGPLVWRIVHKRFDLFEPTTIFAAMILLGYTVPAIMVMRHGDPVWEDWGSRSSGDQAALLRSALIVTLYAVAGFAVGYNGPLGVWVAGRLPLAPSTWSISAFRSISALYIAIGFSSLAILVVLLGGVSVLFGNLNNRVQLLTGLNYFLLGGQFVVVAMWLRYAHLLQRPLRHPMLSGGPLILVALAVTLASGSKFQVLGVLVVVVILGHYLVRRVSFTRGFLLALLGVGLFVGYNLYFREYLIRGYVVLNVHDEGHNAIEAIWWRFSRDTFIQIQTLMLLVDYFPRDHGFLGGQTFASLFTAPIPRSLYPGKPPSPAGVVSTIVFPDLYVRGTSIPPSLVGEAYINFGRIGAFAVMALFGAFYRTAYAYLMRAPKRPAVVLIYAIVATMMIHWIRGESFAPAILIIIQLVPTIIALRAIGQRVTHQTSQIRRSRKLGSEDFQSGNAASLPTIEGKRSLHSRPIRS
jgi:oligosaccharide repeat unit polymerase